MKWLRNLGRFWYDFIVGDDWTIAAAVIVAVATTKFLSHAKGTAWPVVPAAVIVMLSCSIWQAYTRARRDAKACRRVADQDSGDQASPLPDLP
ncbi:MAG: hypothetical protein JWN62_4698 [Acidimicrobiales bacterium]|nr:hypothetical protein [Acidimicrobiales bacterium]